MYAVCLLAVTMHACYHSQKVTHPKCSIRQMVGGDQDQPSSSTTVCLLAVTMHGITIITVKKSPIQDVLYGKWLEVHDQSEIQLQRKYEGFEVCMLCAYLQLPCVLSLSL